MCARPCRLISPPENDAEMSAEGNAKTTQPVFGDSQTSTADSSPEDQMFPQRAARQRRQTAKWRFLCNALSKRWSLVIILQWSSNHNHANIINGQFLPAQLAQYRCVSMKL